MGTNSLFMSFKNLLQQKFVAQITSSNHSSIVNDKNLQGQYPQITSSSHSSMVHCYMIPLLVGTVPTNDKNLQGQYRQITSSSHS